MKKEYQVVGGMAGSSMDGLDLAHITFINEHQEWNFEVTKCQTIAYSDELFKKLEHAASNEINKQKELDIEFGNWIAAKVKKFNGQNDIDLLAIHGHTVLHKPEEGISWQLGSGEKIARETGIISVTNFRDEDVKYGGQGAPLVPFGDFILFDEYDACLNLGGISNVSIKELRIAGDICPCNQVLNFYANKLGHDFDEDGGLAMKGQLDLSFIDKLKSVPYFKKPFPKSLPNKFLPEDLLDSIEPINGLRTYTEFIASEVARSLTDTKKGKLLISGGGAYNSTLVESIAKKLPYWDIHIPPKNIISFKEAIIFGFLGLKKFLGEVNVLSTVTGASMDTSSGVIHLPK